MREHFPNDPVLSHFSRRFVQTGFDPTAIRPIISPATQTRPKALPVSETSLPAHGSPPLRMGQMAASPKRPLLLDDSDNDTERPRKFVRGESPLKGAAGRRLEQQKRNQPHGTPQLDNILPQSAPIPLPPAITRILSDLPKASQYPLSPRFVPERIVERVRIMNLQAAQRVPAMNSSQQKPSSTMPARPPQQIPPPLQQPMPQHPPSVPPVSAMGMPNPYSGGYPTFPQNHQAPSLPPQYQQTPAPPSNLHFPGPNTQTTGFGSAVQGPGYSYGQGKSTPCFVLLG